MELKYYVCSFCLECRTISVRTYLDAVRAVGLQVAHVVEMAVSRVGQDLMVFGTGPFKPTLGGGSASAAIVGGGGLLELSLIHI